MFADALVHWPKFRQFWWLFEQLAIRSHAGRQLLMHNQAVSKLLDIFLGTKCVS